MDVHLYTSGIDLEILLCCVLWGWPVHPPDA